MSEPGELASSAEPLENDWPCMACGYNLRGLKGDSSCPECGEPVSRSLEGKPLSLDDPNRRQNLFIGVLLCCLGALDGAGSYVGVYRFISHGIYFLIPTDLLNLGWTIPWLAGAILMRRSARPEEKISGTTKILYWVLIAHAGAELLIPALRASQFNVSETSISLSFRFLAVLRVVEIAMLTRILMSLAARIPRQPMSLEIKWFGDIFVTTYFVEVFLRMSMRFAAIFHLYHTEPFGGQDIPGLWGFVADNLTFFSTILIPMVFYFPIFLLRFALHIRRASHPFSN
jgi:hypothetical protein